MSLKNRLIIEAILGVILSITPVHVQTFVAQPAYAYESSLSETIEEKIKRIANEHGIEEQHLYNLVQCESGFDPLSDNGYDRGLVQINRKAWPKITDEQAFDPDFALNFAAEKMANGQGYIWVCGNCYLTAKLKIPDLPRMAEIISNTPYPVVGGLAIFYYNGEKHVAVILEVRPDGILVFEGHYEPYLIKNRLVKLDDKNLAGFMRLSP